MALRGQHTLQRQQRAQGSPFAFSLLHGGCHGDSKADVRDCSAAGHATISANKPFIGVSLCQHTCKHKAMMKCVFARHDQHCEYVHMARSVELVQCCRQPALTRMWKPQISMIALVALRRQ
jgi:hypothetical protein